jgi:hypothetical protein
MNTTTAAATPTTQNLLLGWPSCWLEANEKYSNATMFA